MSKEGKLKKEEYQWEAKSQWKKKITNKDLEVIITLYFKDKKVRDIDNYSKILLDSMTGIVWEDDKQIQRMTIEKYIDKEDPRIEVEIFELDPVDN
jgi:crossover junction endodeoxyribonuclease RusA